MGRGWTVVASFLGTFASGLEQIWLIGFQPFTGATTSGISMRMGVEIILEEINANPALLPGYNLDVLWQDSSCSGEKGKNLFLRNIFRKEYTIFAPGVPVGGLDVDGSGLITAEDTVPLQQVWDSSTIAPEPVAIFGAGCSGATMQILPVARRARYPMVSGSATFAGLSDRERYPAFYRTILPDTALTEAFVKLTVELGHEDLVVITSTDSAWDSAAARISLSAVAEGVQLHGEDFTALIPDFRGFRVGTDDTYFVGVARSLVRLAKRIVVLLLYKVRVMRVLCSAQQVGFTTPVYMALGWIDHGWWHSSEGTSCSHHQISFQAMGLIGAQMAHWRHDADTRLSCSANMTSGEFHRAWFARMGVPFGDLSHTATGFAPHEDAATSADAMCMLALMLDKVLVAGSIPLANLTDHTEEAYEAMQNALSTMSFEGVTGRQTFMGQADPSASVSIRQLQGPVDALEYVPLATYADNSFVFQQGTLRFKLNGEILSLSEGAVSIQGTIARYPVCTTPGEAVDFSANQCRGCPNLTTYIQGSCVCVAGHIAGSSQTCDPCVAGRFSTSPGVSACTACEAGRYSMSGQTACEFCSLGTYASETAQSTCTNCPTHQTTSVSGATSMAACDCGVDAYRAGDCHPCPNNSGTVAPFGSRLGIDVCLCSAGHYMTKVENVYLCQACPRGATTGAAGKTRRESCLCRAGSYMSLDHSACLACPMQLSCPQPGCSASNVAFLVLPPSNRTEEQRFPLLAERHWSSAEEPWEIYRCSSKERCPGKSPGWACASGLERRACTSCFQGHFWDGSSCVPCRPYQNGLLLFPLAPLLVGPCFMVALYAYVGEDEGGYWGSWRSATLAAIFVFVNFAQTSGMLTDANILVPHLLRGVLTAHAVVGAIAVDCLDLQGVQPAMALRSLLPVVVTLSGLVSWGGSRLLASLTHCDQVRMDTNRILNVVGSVLFACFGPIAGFSLLLFKCTYNPNRSGRKTLAADLSVVCYSSTEWREALFIGMPCLLLYLLGLGSLWVCHILVAPARINNPSFRGRWRFLFMYYDWSRYWWGIPHCLKTVLTHLCPAVVSSQVVIMYFVMTVIVIYTSAVVLLLPYRSRAVNMFEVTTGLCIIYTTSLLTWHADRDGFPLTEISLGNAALGISLIPLAVMLPCVLYLLCYNRSGSPSEEAVLLAESRLFQLRRSLDCFVSFTEEEGAKVLLELSEADRLSLSSCALLIRSEMMGQSCRRRLGGHSAWRTATEALYTEQRPSNADASPTREDAEQRHSNADASPTREGSRRVFI